MFTELKETLVSVLTAHAGLAALLSDPDAVYYRRPPRERTLPCLTYAVEGRPDARHNAWGAFVVTVGISAWSTSGDTNDAILEALDDALFDAHRNGGLHTANWNVLACRRLKGEVADSGRVEREAEEIEERRTEWSLHIVNKNV